MPVYDFICEECKIKKEVIESYENSCKEHLCDECGKEMIRMFPNKFTFELKYNNKTDMVDWNGNRSMYWDSWKKAKADGTSDSLKMPGHD